MKIAIEINTAGGAFGRWKRDKALETAWVLESLARGIRRRGFVSDGPLCDSKEVPCGTIVATPGPDDQ